MIHGNWLAKWSLVVGEKPAVIDLAAGRSISYGELDQQANRVARQLKDQFGVGRGARVAFLGQNRIEQVELFFAVAKLGAILVPINWRLAAEEVAFVLRDSEPTALFYGADVGETIGTLRKGLWSGRLVGFDEMGPSGYSEMVKAGTPAPISSEGVEEDTPLMLLYTSGTTGRPKGAILTHGMITWNAINTATSWDLRHDDITLTHTPFFHTGGWNVLTLPLLHRGGTVVLARRFDAAETIRAIERHRVTVLFAVPTMFQIMLEQPELRSADLSSVRFFISGGAPCPIPLIQAFQNHGIVFKQGYGLTEVGPNCFVLNERDAVRRAGSVGFPVLHLDTQLVDSNGAEVERGEVGELRLRGPTVCAGYWRNPEATSQALTQDGWFATGDLFRQDEAGYHFVVGRLKEMYKSGGENVYPAEVERVLYQIGGVVEAAVVGVPDEKWGEAGHAFVALDRDKGDPSAEEILAHCRKHLAKFKVPTGVTILPSLPKGSSGKILKQELRQRAIQIRKPQ